MKNGNYGISLELVFREIADEVIILHLKKNLYYSLDGTGSHIWKKISKKKNFQDILASILRKYDVSEKKAESDLTEIIREFLKEKLIQKI